MVRYDRFYKGDDGRWHKTHASPQSKSEWLEDEKFHHELQKRHRMKPTKFTYRKHRVKHRRNVFQQFKPRNLM